MQIFITSRDVDECAQNLDTKRLFKQIIEAHQVLAIIRKPKRLDEEKKNSWEKHPIVAQWKPFADFLEILINAYIKEMKTRKTIKGKPWNLTNAKFQEMKTPDISCVDRPPFMDDEMVLSNHRANLVRKSRENEKYAPWYLIKLGWKEKEANGYIWTIPDPKNPDKTQRVLITNVLTYSGKTKSLRKVL